jgi:hypothetical protein
MGIIIVDIIIWTILITFGLAGWADILGLSKKK